ncbi:MAG: 3'-5' exoribonuclease [Rhizobacter sp.]|nr:3'-5' exoribonuclease [Rhizobacter sp.]
MRVWLDCEFTSIDEPDLLSVGLVAEDGCECYVELLDERLKGRSSKFVLEQVLPLFGRIPDTRAEDDQDLTSRLEGFLLALGDVELLYDYKTDRELIQHALERGRRWRDLKPRVSWRNVSIETCSDVAQDVMEAVFNAAESVGLGRHHALVDARALRLAHLVDGED